MTPARFLPTVTATLALTLMIPAPVHAQLISEQVQDTRRICSYAGEELKPDGRLGPRTFAVGLGQECPATAPYRDPNAPVPANAALLGERTSVDKRLCTYAEGGVEYQLTVDITLRCAMTPALLDAERQAARQGER